MVAGETSAYYVVARDQFSNLQNSGVEQFIIGMELLQAADEDTATGNPIPTLSISQTRSHYR
jgi:hypothetical protein